MGNCICASFDPMQVATAKVVAHDGTMTEFSYPVKVSYLLQLYPACFICDSDDMAFDHVVTAVHEDQLLRLGQLYFALPLTKLKRPLPPEEMAALAVKASSALTNSGGAAACDKCGFRRKQVVLISGEGNGKPCRRVAPEAGGACDTVGRTRKGRRSSDGGGGKFTAMLSSIPE